MSTKKIPSQAVVFSDILDGYIKESEMPKEYKDALSQIDPNKDISKRLLANFKKRIKTSARNNIREGLSVRPIEWGTFRNLSRNDLKNIVRPQRSLISYAADDVLQPNPVYPAGTNFTISYQGLYCRKKAYDRFWSSNEPYLVTSAIHINNQGENIIRTEKHPIGNPQGTYGGVDDREFRNGPIAACWFGPAQPVSLVVVVMENDEGDPNAYKEEIHALLNASGDIFQIITGDKVPDSIIEALTILINWFVGSGDDIIGSSVYIIDEYGLKVGGMDEINKPVYIDGNKTSSFRYYFLTRNNEHGDYYVFFDVQADKQPIDIPNGVNGTPITEENLNDHDKILITL